MCPEPIAQIGTANRKLIHCRLNIELHWPCEQTKNCPELLRVDHLRTATRIHVQYMRFSIECDEMSGRFWPILRTSAICVKLAMSGLHQTNSLSVPVRTVCSRKKMRSSSPNSNRNNQSQQQMPIFASGKTLGINSKWPETKGHETLLENDSN